MCFAKFTNYLAILSSNILLVPPAFVLPFAREYIILFVCSMITALKSLSESRPAHVSWRQLMAFFLLTPIFWEFGMSAIFKCLGHFDRPGPRAPWS